MVYRFCSGHLLGRIGMLELGLEELRALNKTIYLQLMKVTEEEDADRITFIGLIQLVSVAHREFEAEFRALREIADDGLEKERVAAKAQRKEG